MCDCFFRFHTPRTPFLVTTGCFLKFISSIIGFPHTIAPDYSFKVMPNLLVNFLWISKISHVNDSGLRFLINIFSFSTDSSNNFASRVNVKFVSTSPPGENSSYGSKLEDLSDLLYYPKFEKYASEHYLMRSIDALVYLPF